MIVNIDDDFDLQKISESGQCFRFNRSSTDALKEDEPKKYSVVASDKYVEIKKISDKKYEFSCNEDEFESYWKDYFDLDTNYAKIREKINKDDDAYLYTAAEFGKGIRILRQNPWEMLISFIISQRKKIPAIKASIEKLCIAAGEVISESEDGDKIYSFPTPEKLSALPLDVISSCSLGYRDKYVHRAAIDVCSGVIDLNDFNSLDDDKLMEHLLKIYGVGVKVANCEILFGYHRLNAFPRDVWINRVLDERYPKGFNFERYAPYNGVMQQYLFFYSRNRIS